MGGLNTMLKFWKWTFSKKERRANGDVQDDIADTLVLPEVLEKNSLSKVSKKFTYYTCFLICIACIWFSIAQIQELVIAPGQVIPSGMIKKIHHLEGGLVEDVHISEGDIVEKGDLLVTLSSSGPGQDLKQLEVRKVHLTLSGIRLSALLAGEKPDFSNWLEQYPKLVQDQNNLYQTAFKRNEQKILALRSKILQSKSEIRAFNLEHKANLEQAQFFQQKVEIKRRLLKKGYSSRKDYLDAQTEYQTAKAREVASAGKLSKAQLQLTEANINLEEAKAETRNTYSEEYTRLSRELDELKQTITKFKDRVQRLQVRSPFKGIVQELIPQASGEVIKAGDLVANIVGLNEDMIIQAEVAPADIAQIKIDDIVNIKVSAYDSNIFGFLPGKVKKISASTFQKQDGTPYYKALIHLDKSYFEKNEVRHLILPGMEVQAEIITGAKSLVKYMLKPVYNSLNTAFTER